MLTSLLLLKNWRRFLPFVAVILGVVFSASAVLAGLPSHSVPGVPQRLPRRRKHRLRAPAPQSQICRWRPPLAQPIYFTSSTTLQVAQVSPRRTLKPVMTLSMRRRPMISASRRILHGQLTA